MREDIRDRIEMIQKGEIPKGYKKTKLCILPKDWKLEKISDCLQRVENLVAVDLNSEYMQIGIRSHGKGLFYKEPVLGKDLGNKKVYWIESDCFIVNIVFAWEQAVGKTTKKEVGMVGSHRFPMYKPINQVMNVDYLVYYFVTQIGKNIMEYASPGGAGRNRTLGQDRFMKSKMIVPSLLEQEKIVEILKCYDKKIYLLCEKIKKLNEQKKWLMQNLLTGKKRLKEFDDKWKSMKLFELCRIEKGVQINGDTLSDKGSYYMLNGGIQASGYLEKWNCNENTISISEGGNSCGYVNYNEEKFWSGGHCYTLKKINKKIDTQYLYQYLKSKEKKIMALRVGSGLPNIQKKSLETIKVVIPKFEEQLIISNVLMKADKEIKLLQQKLEKTRLEKNAMMQLLLTGIVRVN